MATLLVVLGIILVAAGAFLIHPGLALIAGGAVAFRSAQLVTKGVKING